MRRSEAGFTLIELLVVVLILGILMAVALPTFLSLTTSARSNGTEENVSTAGNDEIMFFLRNGIYGSGVSSPAMGTLDAGITWQTCTTPGSTCVTDPGGQKVVYAWVTTYTTGSYPTVVVGGAGQNGKYYWEMVTQDPVVSSLAFQVTASASLPTLASFQTAPVATTWSQAGG